MNALKLEAEDRLETTTISNWFIDRYMPRANGEYIKIYLILMRYFQTPEAELTVSALADFLECTEKDVNRGLAYWEREGVLSLSFDGEHRLSGVRLLDPHEQVKAEKETAASKEASPADTGEEVNAPEPAKPYREAGVSLDLEKLCTEESFTQLLNVVAAYKKKPLSHEDCDILAYLYDTLGMSGELLEYLAETCIDSGITGVRSMEKIALDWHAKGIATPEQAKATQEVFRRDMWAIMKAFGLNGRRPAAVEKKMMDKWLRQFGFDLDVILEACDRTIRQIQQPSFAYADRILTDWKEKGVRTPKDIAALDKAARPGRGAKAPQTENSRESAGKNRFHNYEQRNTDYDSLIEKQGFLKKKG